MSEEALTKVAILISIFCDSLEGLTLEQAEAAYKRARELVFFYEKKGSALGEHLEFYLGEARDLLEKDDWSFLDWD